MNSLMMKRSITILAALTLTTLTSASAFAAFNSDQMLEAASIALQKFNAGNAHAQHFTGFKSWQSADDAKIKIYINHNGMAMEANYTCHVEADTQITCSEN